MNFDFGKMSHLKVSKLPKNAKFRAAQMVKMALFGAFKHPKKISRKIRVVEKSWNFHIVYSQLGCPGLYNIFIFRQYHTGKNKVENNLFHPFKRALVRSHPLTQEIILSYREPPKKDELPPEVKAMMIL